MKSIRSFIQACVEFVLAQSVRLNERRGEAKLGAKYTRTKGNKTNDILDFILLIYLLFLALQKYTIYAVTMAEISTIRDTQTVCEVAQKDVVEVKS